MSHSQQCALTQHAVVPCLLATEHIQKQLERGYASKDAQLTFWPTPLGESLISAYRRMGLDNLWKPDLRGRIEQGISRIAAGLVTKDTVSYYLSVLASGYSLLASSI